MVLQEDVQALEALIGSFRELHRLHVDRDVDPEATAWMLARCEAIRDQLRQSADIDALYDRLQDQREAEAFHADESIPF